MNQLKRHWPLLLTVIVTLWTFLDFRLIGNNYDDAFGMGFFYFYLLMPFCALLASFWYGYRIPGRGKWFCPPFFALLEVVLVMTCAGDWDLAGYWSMCFLTMIPALAGLALGLSIRKKK